MCMNIVFRSLNHELLCLQAGTVFQVSRGGGICFKTMVAVSTPHTPFTCWSVWCPWKLYTQQGDMCVFAGRLDLGCQLFSAQCTAASTPAPWKLCSGRREDTCHYLLASEMIKLFQPSLYYILHSLPNMCAFPKASLMYWEELPTMTPRTFSLFWRFEPSCLQIPQKKSGWETIQKASGWCPS